MNTDLVDEISDAALACAETISKAATHSGMTEKRLNAIVTKVGRLHREYVDALLKGGALPGGLQESNDLARIAAQIRRENPHLTEQAALERARQSPEGRKLLGKREGDDNVIPTINVTPDLVRKCVAVPAGERDVAKVFTKGSIYDALAAAAEEQRQPGESVSKSRVRFMATPEGRRLMKAHEAATSGPSQVAGADRERRVSGPPGSGVIAQIENYARAHQLDGESFAAAKARAWKENPSWRDQYYAERQTALRASGAIAYA